MPDENAAARPAPVTLEMDGEADVRQWLGDCKPGCRHPGNVVCRLARDWLAMHKRIAELESALEFYAKHENWEWGKQRSGNAAVLDDGGLLARAALEGVESHAG